MSRCLPSLIFLGLNSVLAGCSYFHNLQTPHRLDRGYTIILPGVEGASFANSNLATGLEAGGVQTAIEVDDWTTGSVWRFPLHLQDLDRNRREAGRIAQKIVRYQRRYPGRPVFLIGHSGGGGMVLLTLEALPGDHQVTGAILLAPAVSPEFDLRPALSKTVSGIWNFYSPLDSFFLIAGTSVMGTIDRQHTPSAGALGFTVPEDCSPQDRRLFEERLHQVPYDVTMAASGHVGGHLGPTWIRFAQHHLAPLLIGADVTFATDEMHPELAGAIESDDSQEL